MSRLGFLVSVLCICGAWGDEGSAGMGPAVCPNLNDPVAQYQIASLLLDAPKNRFIRPAVHMDNGDYLTTVSSNFYLTEIEHLDVVSGRMTIRVIFRQRWNDPRLAFKDLPELCAGTNVTGAYIQIPQSLKDSMWTPDLFISNQVGHVERYSLFKPNVYIRVYGNGDVLLSQRLSFTVSCPNLQTTKECSMKIESYGHKGHELALEWYDKDPIYYLGAPVKATSADTVPLPFTRVAKTEPLRCDSVSPAGLYSCIQAKITFE